MVAVKDLLYKEPAFRKRGGKPVKIHKMWAKSALITALNPLLNLSDQERIDYLKAAQTYHQPSIDEKIVELERFLTLLRPFATSETTESTTR